MKEIDAAIEALDALVVCSADLAGDRHGFDNHWHKLSDKGAAAIAGLRSLKEQERYGYVVTDTRGMQYFYKDTPYLDTAVECQEVFTHPAPEQTKQVVENFDELEQEPVLQDIEQYRMQMAGICTAALGYWKEGDSIHPDYDTPALREVAKLYAKYVELEAKQEPEEDHGCWKCGEDGGTSCGAVHCGLLETEEDASSRAS